VKIDRGLNVPLFRRSLLYSEPVSPSLSTTNIVIVYARCELEEFLKRKIDGMRLIIHIHR
jgi:hypothetical protein